MFWIKLRHVKKIAKGVQGEANPIQVKRPYQVKEFFDVKISERTNKRLGTYFKTLLHEFLHIMFFILENYHKFGVTAQSEHEFIDAMEDSLMTNWHLLKEKRQKKK